MMIIVPLLSENINTKTQQKSKSVLFTVCCLNMKKVQKRLFEGLNIFCQLFVLANKEGANVLHWSVMGGWCAESHLGQNEHLT